MRSASSVIAEKGFDGASVRDISAATGVSLSGLYYYFSSKDELLFLIQKHCFETILDRLRSDLEGVEDPEARLRVLVHNHLRFFSENIAEMKVLSHEADALPEKYRGEIVGLKREYNEAMADILSRLAPEDDGIDLRVATFSLFGMMNWIYTWYRPGKDVPVDRLAEHMLHLFLHGYRRPVDRAQPQGGGETGPTSIWTTSS